MFKVLLCLALLVSMNVSARDLYILKNKDGEAIITNVPNDSRFSEYNKEEKKIWYTDYPNTNNLSNKQIRVKILELKALLRSDIDNEGNKITDEKKSGYLNTINYFENELSKRALAAKPNIKIGMSAKQVALNSNWGKPDSVNRTTLASGVQEQWVYPGRGYLYFVNGKLVAIQD